MHGVPKNRKVWKKNNEDNPRAFKMKGRKNAYSRKANRNSVQLEQLERQAIHG